MASRRLGSGIGQLWQLPMLLISFSLFGYAAYLFIDPQPGQTLDQKIDVAKQLLKNERPEAAINQLNEILNSERMEKDREGVIHQLLAQSLDALQQQKHVDLKTYHEQIIEQTNLATSMGVRTTYDMQRRLGENFEALGKPVEALEHYRQAMAMDPNHALRLQRKVIDLQLAQNDVGPAEASLETYLHSKELADAERVWALCNQAKLLIDREQFVKARLLLDQAIKLDSDMVAQGEVNYYLGYCALKLGDRDEAERLLRTARQQLGVEQSLDAQAAFLLAGIFEDRGDNKTAMSFYQDLLISHPEAKLATAALLGRGMCRLIDHQDDPGLSDLQECTKRVGDRASLAEYKPKTIADLAQAAVMLSARGDFRGAIEMLFCEQQLEDHPPAAFFGRLANVYEQRANQLEHLVDEASQSEKIRRAKEVRELLTKAGDASVAYSHELTLADDKGYSDALWKGIDLYDRAANIQAVVSALELFVAERPDDPLAPSALLRLGLAYQATGLNDKAIAVFQRNQFRYPNSLAASKSAVPLAQAFIAKGPDAYAKAEAVLKNVIENNPLLTPEADEFKQALFELAQLYYRTGRYEDAIARIEDLTLRYPDDAKLGQLNFMMADSYRKSAALIDLKPALASATAGARDSGAVAFDMAEAAEARKDRLNRAKALYDRVVDVYRDSPPKNEVDITYNKLSHFYRADCLYDLGQYEEAIRQYDAAASRYQNDPSSLAAYVQIVNAYYALGKPDAAKAATERAKWLLRRIPDEAFTNGSFAMPKSYWEDQLKWTGDAGMQ